MSEREGARTRGTILIIILILISIGAGFVVGKFQLASLRDENLVLQGLVEQLINPKAHGFGLPDYDSGWTSIGAGDIEYFDHGLETKDDLFVYVIGRYSEDEFNQYFYGFSYEGENQYGSSWSVDDTTVYVQRGTEDEDWEEVRIYIWRILQGSAGLPESANDTSIPDIKYEEIILSGEDTFNYSKIIDLEGYKDVTISWINEMEKGQLVFWWNIQKSNGTYFRVVPAFTVDYSGGPLYEIDDLARLYIGSESFRVRGKYLEISTYHSTVDDYEWESYDEVHIIIYATK